MDRIWQWTWDQFAAHYRWAVAAVLLPITLPVYLLWSFLLVSVEGTGHYVEAAVITVGLAALVHLWLGFGARWWFRPIERWVSGADPDPVAALRATYVVSRAGVLGTLLTMAIQLAVLSIVVGVAADANGSRVAHYALLGVTVGLAIQLVGVHSMLEGAMRPVRLAIAGDSGVGDELPRSRPTYATWLGVSVLATVFAFTLNGAMLSTAFDEAREQPLLFGVMAVLVTLALGFPLTVGFGFAPAVRPVRELSAATERVATGDYGTRVPVVQDDDLGVLAASFNRMQAGLAERQRLHAAFGTYVDPMLAARLLEQGDDVFTGDRREVTLMFIDIRDFTPFAEQHSAEDTVARLNELFGIVVPAVVDAGGHVNKFLGDGALAVFGAPAALADHAGAAVRAAITIRRQVALRFAGDLRVGIGINTGVVIAGTIGAGGKLEFTLIGDAVNVAARVEQATKSTGDTILVTQQTVDALPDGFPGLTARGSFALKGKSAPAQLYGID